MFESLLKFFLINILCDEIALFKLIRYFAPIITTGSNLSVSKIKVSIVI